MQGWEHFHHGADIGVHGFGESREAAFAEAAVATNAVVADPDSITPKEPVEVECESPQDELLLVEWLNTMLFEMANRKMLFRRFEVHITDHHLNARMWGEHIDRGRHEAAVEVKGATYTELRVQEKDGVWHAQCIVDV